MRELGGRCPGGRSANKQMAASGTVKHCLRRQLSLWLALLACAGFLATSEAARQQRHPAERPQNVELYLLADYAQGFPVTVAAPQLMAQLVSSKFINCRQDVCSPCLQQQATVMSRVTQSLFTGSLKSLPATAKCTGPTAFKAGLYSLQAGIVEGSEEANWSCFRHNNNGSMSELNVSNSAATQAQPTVEIRKLSSSSSAMPRNSSKVAAQSSSTSNSAPSGTTTVTAYTVDLRAGNTYSCVAFYTPAKPPAATPAAATQPTPTTAPAAVTPLEPTQLQRVNSTQAGAAAPTGGSTAATPTAQPAAEVTSPIVAEPAALTQEPSTAAVPAASHGANQTVEQTTAAATTALAAQPGPAPEQQPVPKQAAVANVTITNSTQTTEAPSSLAEQLSLNLTAAAVIPAPAQIAVEALNSSNAPSAATPATAPLADTPAAAVPATAPVAAVPAAAVPAAATVPAASPAASPAAGLMPYPAMDDLAAVVEANAAATSNTSSSNSSSSSNTSALDSNVTDAAALTTDTMTFSTTDMTTDLTTTSTVTFNTTTGEIIELGDTRTVAAMCSPPAYRQPPRGNPAAPLIASGNRLFNTVTKRATYIRGINWFGFNVELGMLNGLWAGGLDAATDFSKIAYQLKQLGFNAVRLPFAHKFLANTEVWDAVRDCTAMTERDLKLRLIDPQDISAKTMSLDLPVNPSLVRNSKRGACNTYLPSRSNADRFLFSIQQFIAQGMYVVLDYQPQGLENHAYNLAEFVGAWKDLWKKITCLPNFDSDIAGRVLIDVMNEPDSMGIKWEANGEQPGAEQLYLATAEALWRMTPNKMLFMFEGTGQNMYGLNWGNGFITDKDIVKTYGLSDPTSFFSRLLKRPFAKHSIISPHLYPPSITKSTFLGEKLWKQSNTSFGYLQSKGFCDTNNRCYKFPIVIGETGSAFKEEDDKTWLMDFAAFAMARGDARAYNTIPLSGWMWWAFNENSGDTGGIVMNNWQDYNWIKLRYMMTNLGLQPWYKHSVSSLRRRSRNNSRLSVASSRGRGAARRHRRHGGHVARAAPPKSVQLSWEELGFDIGTLPATS